MIKELENKLPFFAFLFATRLGGIRPDESRRLFGGRAPIRRHCEAVSKSEAEAISKLVDCFVPSKEGTVTGFLLSAGAGAPAFVGLWPPRNDDFREGAPKGNLFSSRIYVNG